LYALPQAVQPTKDPCNSTQLYTREELIYSECLDYRLNDQGFDFRWGKRVILFATASKSSLWDTQNSMEEVLGVFASDKAPQV
jgi:hypothetical protein